MILDLRTSDTILFVIGQKREGMTLGGAGAHSEAVVSWFAARCEKPLRTHDDKPQEVHDSRIAHARITKRRAIEGGGKLLECPSLLSRRRLRPFIRLQGGGCNRNV